MKTPIAIVEHDPDASDGLRRLIDDTSDFICVCACRTGAEALARVPAARPAIIVQDLQLPDMPGQECVSLLRRRLPAVRIVMFTACADSDRIIGAIQAGADGYLLKSTPPARIVAAMRELLAGGAPLSGPVGRTMIEHLQRAHAAAASLRPANTLTSREREVMSLLAAGLSSKEIAARLSISSETVNAHLKHCYEKLGARTRVEAAMAFLGGGSIRRESPDSLACPT